MSNLLVAGVKEDDPAKFSNMQTITNLDVTPVMASL